MRGEDGVNTPHRKLPIELIKQFCAAIAYATDDRRPTARERVTLELVLGRIARVAHQSGVTPERVLIELKNDWTRVCHRDPSPDMHDPLWNAVVKMTLDAYERVRSSAA
jgi:hypothetical protein